MAVGQGARNGSAYSPFTEDGGSQSNEVEREEKDSKAVLENSCGGKGGTNGEIIGEGGGGGSAVLAEIKLQCLLAWPIIVANLLSYSFVVVSIMFVGHLGELELSSASVANSFAVVTGFSVMSGLSTGLETLCGQAYGAKQYHQLGVYLQSAFIVSFLFTIPILILWLNMEKVLLAVGQDPEISRMAASYVLVFTPGLIGAAFNAPLVRYLQMQSLVLPIMINSLIAAILQPFWCYTFIYVLGFGFHGGAMATVGSYILLCVLNIAYILWSGECNKCWGGFAVREALGSVGTYLSFAVPSVVMICFEFWSFELLVLSSGLLPRPSLELSLLTVSLTTVNFADTIPLGVSVAASIRVSNELGANRPDAAKLATKVVLGLGIADGCVIFVTLLLLQNKWGHAFTSITEILDYVAQVTPLIALLTLMDPIAAVMSGVLRGCGRQARGASINLLAYYLIGIPLSLFLGFRLHLHGKGLVMGVVFAIFMQVIFLFLSIWRTNWRKVAEKAQEQVRKASSDRESLLPSHS